MKKRNIVLGLLALEILCLPVSAQIVDKVLFSVPQQAASVTLPEEPGMTQLVVVSNSPFVITSRDVIADMDISVHLSGDINGTRFGDNAQMPGPSEACASTLSADKMIIYTSEQRTAAKRGEVLSQSVIVEINYPADFEPVFEVVTRKHGRNLPEAASCGVGQT